MDANKSLTQVMKDAQGNLVLANDPASGGQGQLQAQAASGGTPASPAAAASGGASPAAAAMAGTPNQSSATPALGQTPSGTGGGAAGLGQPGMPGSSQSSPAPGGGVNGYTLQPQTTAPQQVQANDPMRAGARLEDVVNYQRNTPAVPDAAAQKKADDAKRMQSMYGDLGTRVQSVIDKAAFLAQAPSAGAAGGTLTDAAKALTADQQAALQAVIANPTDESKVQAAARAVGATGGDLSKYIQNLDTGGGALADQTAKDAAANTNSNLTLNDQTVTALGYDKQQLADALGVPVDQLGKMSLADAQAKIEDQLKQETSQVDSIKSQLNDPALGPNERAAAWDQLRQMGATGVFATSEDMSKLSDSVKSADTVQFNGQPMTVQELLGDQKISESISSYVQDPNSSDSKKFAAAEPALADWAKQHSAALKDLSLNLSATEKKFTDTQGNNQKVTDALTTAGMTTDQISSVMKTLYPDWEPGLGMTSVDTSKLVGLPGLMDPSAASQAGMNPTVYSENFVEASKVSPEAAAKLAQMTPDQLAQLGAGTQDSPQWKQFMARTQQSVAVNKLDAANPNSVASFLLGGKGGVADLQKMLTEAEQGAKFGGGGGGWLAGVLDPNHSGKLAPMDQIVAALKKQAGDPTAGQNGPLDFKMNLDGFAGAVGKAAGGGPVTADVINKVAPALQGMSASDLYSTLTNYGKNMDPSGRAALQKVYEQKRTTDTQSQLKDLFSKNSIGDPANLAKMNTPVQNAPDFPKLQAARSKLYNLVSGANPNSTDVALAKQELSSLDKLLADTAPEYEKYKTWKAGYDQLTREAQEKNITGLNATEKLKTYKWNG